MVSKNDQGIRHGRDGIGFYSYAQIKYVTPFQYLPQLLVGALITCMGLLLLYFVTSARSEEIKRYGAAQLHFWSWLGTGAMIIIGLFMAHAGLIFYSRKVSDAVYRSWQGSRKHRKSRVLGRPQ